MSEIRNLTRNGETFYPLTTSSAVINESTGEGLIIDDEPTMGSENLVKSGGVYEIINGNEVSFSHTFNQSQALDEHAPFPNPIPTGTIIDSLDAGPAWVWLTRSNGNADTNLSNQTLPYVTTKDFYGIRYAANNGTVTLSWHSGTLKIGLTQRIENVEANVIEVEDEVVSLKDYVKGNHTTFSHTFVQEQAYGEYVPFNSPLSIGTNINKLIVNNSSSVVWLCGQATTSRKKLTGETLPFVTEEVYYGLRCSLQDTVTIDYSPTTKQDGLEDKIKPFIRINSYDTQYEVFQKMRKAFVEGDYDVFFEKAIYTLDDVYNNIIDIQGTWLVGLPIGNNCRYFFNGATIISNVPNALWNHPRNVLDSMGSAQTFEVHDVILINNGGTYCIHDEGRADVKPYTHKYENVTMKYVVTDTTSPNGANTFGCGLGYDSTLIFNNCLFLNSGEGSRYASIGIHGINVENPSPCVFRMFMSNCYVPKAMAVTLVDKNRDTIEYYLNNNKWSTDFDTTNSTFAVKFGNVV